MKNKIFRALFLIGLILYEEFLFLGITFKSIDSFICIALFSIVVALLLHLLTSLWKPKLNAVLSYLLVFLTTFIFSAQYVYYTIYQAIISFFSMTNGGGQILQFTDMILKTILENWWQITLILLPNILLIILHKTKVISFEKISKKHVIISILLAVLLHVCSLIIINFVPEDTIYSKKNLYYNVHTPTLSVQKFGIITTMRLDLQRYITNFEEKELDVPSLEVVAPPEENIETKPVTYNMLDIDFEALANNASNKNIKKIHTYMSNGQATNQNKYTGMFKEKNLIVFVAEGFSSIAIREDVTPTLYKLYNEGFQFNNFYTPIFPVSTADGEYITDTSLIPKEGVWSMSKLENNYMPYSYANVFKKLGYSTNAYHNHTSTYYNRHKYIKAMGYDSYLAKGTGLEKRMDCSKWPNSDYDMIRTTTEDYVENNNFIAYYMTVSGHLNYTTSGNYIANKNWNLVKDLPYSHKAKAYLATQIELDKAIEQLIKDLEAAKKLEDTVIAISSDHFPYGLTLEEINELSTYQRDNTFEKYHMPFLVWNSQMEEPIEVDKIGSSLDVLPTLLNLFGIEYDSRLLIGNDILSDANPLVIFSDRSFITDKGRYNSLTKKFIPNDGVEIPENYVQSISSIIYEKYQISRLILENDYYKYLKDYL